MPVEVVLLLRLYGRYCVSRVLLARALTLPIVSTARFGG